jgi:hypothetical protein
MNVRIERVMNFESLDAKIMPNRALDQKICVLKAFRGKMVFSGGSEVILKFL